MKARSNDFGLKFCCKIVNMAAETLSNKKISTLICLILYKLKQK